MIVKIVRNDGHDQFYECNRVFVGGYNGSSGIPGTPARDDGETTRNLHLESNEAGGSISTVFTKNDRVYLLNSEGKTIDSIYF